MLVSAAAATEREDSTDITFINTDTHNEHDLEQILKHHFNLVFKPYTSRVFNSVLEVFALCLFLC